MSSPDGEPIVRRAPVLEEWIDYNGHLCEAYYVLVLGRLWHELWVNERLRATEEVLGVHVDTAAGRSSPLPHDVVRRAQAIRAAPPPEASGSITMR